VIESHKKIKYRNRRKFYISLKDGIEMEFGGSDDVIYRCDAYRYFVGQAIIDLTKCHAKNI